MGSVGCRRQGALLPHCWLLTQARARATWAWLEEEDGWHAAEGHQAGLLKSLRGLSDFTFTFHFHALEKEMATHSSVLAWRIPGTGEPDSLLSMGSHRVGHN